MCPIHNFTASKLMEESDIMVLPSHYSICPSYLMYLVKQISLEASVLYEQLLSSAPYAVFCPISNSMFIFFIY